MTTEKFKQQMAGLIEEIGHDTMNYRDKMTCIGTTVFCLFAMMEALAHESVKLAQQKKGQNQDEP